MTARMSSKGLSLRAKLRSATTRYGSLRTSEGAKKKCVRTPSLPKLRCLEKKPEDVR